MGSKVLPVRIHIALIVAPLPLGIRHSWPRLLLGCLRLWGVWIWGVAWLVVLWLRLDVLGLLRVLGVLGILGVLRVLGLLGVLWILIVVLHVGSSTVGVLALDDLLLSLLPLPAPIDQVDNEADEDYDQKPHRCSNYDKYYIALPLQEPKLHLKKRRSDV